MPAERLAEPQRGQQTRQGRGAGSLFTIAHGIKYAADFGKSHHEHVIINLSLGGSSGFDPVDFIAELFSEFLAVTLGQAPEDDDRLKVTFFFHLTEPEDRFDGFTFSLFDESASIHDGNVRFLDIRDDLVAFFFKAAEGHFRINKGSRTAKTYETYFHAAFRICSVIH